MTLFADNGTWGVGRKLNVDPSLIPEYLRLNAITPTQKSAVEKSDVSSNATKLIDRMFTRFEVAFPRLETSI